MTDEQILELLKMDLQISTTKLDTFLTSLMSASKSAIEREGIVFSMDEEGNLSNEDADLVRTYTAYLYSKRREDVPMPRNLRYRLNNRLFSQKARVL